MKPFCKGDTLYLRAAQPADAARVARWKDDALVRRMALDADYEASEESERQNIESAAGSERELYLIVVLRDGDQPIGYVRVNWQDAQHKHAWLRFALGERRGEGHAKAALRCLFTHLFDRGLHRVDAEVVEFNVASLAVLERLGFLREGLKRKAHHDGEKWRAMIALGLLKEDFVG